MAFNYGDVYTPEQWAALFNAKQNALGYTPVNKAGDVLSGILVFSDSDNAAASFRIPSGSAPLTPTDGDVWVEGGALYQRLSGVTVRYDPVVVGNVAVSNGLNSNIAIAAAALTRIRLTGPTGGFSIGGFTGGVSGKRISVYNTVAQQMTIVNEDASSAAANRIKTLTGANVVLRSGTSICNLVYDSTDQRWVLESYN